MTATAFAPEALHPTPALSPAARHFEPVSLFELSIVAENLTRHDRKYVVALSDLPAILASFPSASRILEIDDAQHFPYTSTYLDTLELDSYRLAATRRRRRFKVRTRNYSNGAAYLEVKTRGQRGLTVKERIPFDGEHPLSATSAAFIADAFAVAHIDGPHPADLWPALRTSYTRTTFLLPDDEARVTIDTDLAFRSLAADPASRARRAAAPHGGVVELGPLAIVETKAMAATAVDHALWSHGYRPTRISKYAAGLIITNPELRPGRWHRTLTHLVPDALSA